MLEAIISGSAADNYTERELWAESGELQRPNRLRTIAALEALRHPKTKAFQPKAPPQPCATQNRVFKQPSTYKPYWGTGAAGFGAGGCRPSALKVSVLTSPYAPRGGSMLPWPEVSTEPIL